MNGQTPPKEHPQGTCDDVIALIPSYSLGTTDPAETRFVETMLEHCPEAAVELAEYMALTESMLYLVPDARAPRPKTGAVMPPTARKPGATANRSGVGRWLVGVGFAAVLVAVVGLWRYWDVQFALVRSQIAQQSDTQQQILLALQRGEVHHRALRVSSVLPGEVTIPAGAEAQVIWNTPLEFGTLYVSGLPALAANEIYQLWLVRDGHSLSLGTFRVDGQGTGVLVFDAPEPITSFEHVGISREPVQGSPAPTGAHLLIGDI